ncbi:NTP transferase domain-containing protein [Lewinella sp. JB7]|uniref:nucleotidyltransferase family protein n=1 Tax=Lewinella sp. JB7 TaxID=2962887 RepID=UPI0020C9B975|nr:nucleotidyltransferase family protein [Lewinella sp. JB7]MCP9237603.1 nucleotidyltransferase family protein [Lewinella sp. JB7]
MNPALLILAAGRSQRMGQPKQLLPWKGGTLLRHTVRRVLEAGEGEVFVVLGAHGAAVSESLAGLPVELFHNPAFAEGLGSSLSVGARRIAALDRFTHLLVILGDQPGISPDYLREMLNEGREHPDRIVATAYGERSGVPALFPAAYLARLAEGGGDAGAARILNANPTDVLRLTPPTPLFDIDTPEDYRRHEGD